MDWLHTGYEFINNLPIYRHGWLLFGILAIIPAVVSGNMIQHALTVCLRGNKPWRQEIKSLGRNLAILVVSITFIGIAIYKYLY